MRPTLLIVDDHPGFRLLARRLLESTDVPVERVAEQAGFGTTASMRQHLHAAIGVAPLAYRRTYRGPVAHPM